MSQIKAFWSPILAKIGLFLSKIAQNGLLLIGGLFTSCLLCDIIYM